MTQTPPDQDESSRGTWSAATEHPSGRAPKHRVSPVKSAIHGAAVKILRAAPKPIVRLAANAYIAGEERTDALRAVDDLYAKNGSALDLRRAG